VLRAHLVELVDAAHALVGEDKRALQQMTVESPNRAQRRASSRTASRAKSPLPSRTMVTVRPVAVVVLPHT
jgi:hypothetical protein